METLYDRLVTIASREFPAAKKNRGIQELTGLSSGRISQIKDEGEAARLGEPAMAKVLSLGYLRDWVVEGRGPCHILERPGPISVVREPPPRPFIHPDETIRQIVTLLESTDDVGRGVALLAVAQALEKYRPIKETAA